jgi:hypothetical protein
MSARVRRPSAPVADRLDTKLQTITDYGVEAEA